MARAADGRGVGPAGPALIELWARAYAATLVIEVPIATGFLRDRLPAGEAAALAVAASTLTHPALWFLFPRFEPGWLWLVVAEGAVWAAEAAVYTAWLRWRGADAPWRGVWVGVLANASSTAVGLLLLGARGAA